MTRPSYFLSAGAVVGLLLGSARGAAPAPGDYVKDIAAAQADLDAGRVAEAKAKLAAIPEARRGWEYDYLLARAAAATGKGAAPDLVRTIPWPKVECRYGVLDEVNRRVVFVGRDGGLRVYDLAAPDALPKEVAHEKGGAIWSGAFSRDGTTFAAGHEKGEVVVRDAKTWAVRHALPVGAGQPVRELAVAPDGSAVVAEGQAELELWSLGKEAKKVAGVGPRYNFGEGLAFSPKGDVVATGGMFDIILHDAKTGEKKGSFRHASYTMGLEFAPDGKRVASAPRGNVNKFLGVFDAATGEPVFRAGPFADYVAGLAFTPDGKRVAATGCEKLLRLFDAESGEVALGLPRPTCGAKPAVSRDGRLLGWSEPGGYRYIDLGPKPGGKGK